MRRVLCWLFGLVGGCIGGGVQWWEVAVVPVVAVVVIEIRLS